MNVSRSRDPRSWRKWANSGSVVFNQQNHPEIREGEVWITNADEESFGEIGWRSKRRGVIAMDKFGQPLGNRWRGAFPVFALKSELGKSEVVIKHNPN